MKLIRKVMAATLAVAVMASMLLLSGCSTPKVAMTVDGKEYTTGEYLAALYGNFSFMYYDNQLYQYETYYGTDPWTETFPYGEEGKEVDMLLADYIIAITKDSIVRQTAVKNMMEANGITVSEEDLAKLDEDLAGVSESEMIQYGFSKDSYRKMMIASSLDEKALFYGLYGEGGKRAIPEDEIRAFYDDNYVAYKAITLDVTEETDQATLEEKLAPYLEQFNESKDMDAVIDQYTADSEAAAEEETTEEGAEGTTEEETTEEETTEEVTEEETTEEETTEEVTEEETTEEEATEEVTEEETTEEEATEEESEEEEVDANLMFADTVSGDEKLVEAIKTVAEGEAKIVSYTDANEATHVALIYRLNVDEAGGEDYYGEQKENVIYGIAFEEFNTEVKAAADKLAVEYNDRAIKMCDPKNFLPEEAEA